MTWMTEIYADISYHVSFLCHILQDYGPENVYAALQDVCVEMSKDQYKYRVCSFGKAAQVEGSSEISLGTFNRCEDGCSSMFFTQVWASSKICRPGS